MAQFSFDQAFQRRILALLISSTKFLVRARDLVKPEHFQERESWILATLVYEFYDKYQKAPGEFITNLIHKHSRRAHLGEEDIELLILLVESLEPNQPHEEVILDEVTEFVKHAEVRKALEDFAPSYASGNYNLSSLVHEIDRIQKQQHVTVPPVDYLQTVSERIRRRGVRSKILEIATLIPELDSRMGGIREGQLGTIVAPSGIGKSFFLTHLGKAAVLQGQVVYHFSLEMLAHEVEDRYDQMVVGAKLDELQQSQTALRTSLQQLIAPGGKLFIDYLDVGTTVAILRTRILQVSQDTGTVPGMVIVDYGELLAVDSEKAYEAQGEIWRRLKALAVEFSCPFWTATQASREAVGVRRVTEIQVADSYHKVRISDIVIGFNRNMLYDPKKREWKEIEENDGHDVVRLFVIKHRQRQASYEIKFVANFDRGQFYGQSETVAWKEKMVHKRVKGEDKNEEL